MGCNCRDKKIIETEKAPKAVGPYSIGAIGSNLVFTSGQIGLDPKTQNLVKGGIGHETEQVINNIKNILEEAGSGLGYVVKTTVFLRDLNEFNSMNEIYSGFFIENPPARSTIQVVGLPKYASVMIEAVAVIPCKCECDGDCKCKDDCNCGSDNDVDKDHHCECK